MGDFLEVLDFSPTSPKTTGAGADCLVALDETVFIRGGNGKIFSSEGVVMPVAAEVQAEDEEAKKNVRVVNLLSSEGIVMRLAVELQANKEEDEMDANKSKISTSEGIVMPLAAELHVDEDEKGVKLRLLHKWEEEMDADDETTTDEENSSGCSSSDENDPVPESPKQQQEVVEEEKPFIQAEAGAEYKPRRPTKQCSLPDCVKTATLKGLCVSHGGSKRCEHPGCTKKALRSGKCFCHGGGIKCSIQGCTKQALIKGMCVAHCGNIAPQGAKGLSVKQFGRKSSGFSNGEARDNGEGPKCARPRCTNAAINKGLCIDHGGYVPCSVSGCVTRARVKDKCLAHAYRHPGCAKQARVGERHKGYGGRARC